MIPKIDMPNWRSIFLSLTHSTLKYNARFKTLFLKFLRRGQIDLSSELYAFPLLSMAVASRRRLRRRLPTFFLWHVESVYCDLLSCGRRRRGKNADERHPLTQCEKRRRITISRLICVSHR